MSKRGLYKLMKRSLLKNLVEWKNSPRRKPLILKGVRQVGKTWLLKEFGRLYYENVAYFNFCDDNFLTQPKRKRPFPEAISFEKGLFDIPTRYEPSAPTRTTIFFFTGLPSTISVTTSTAFALIATSRLPAISRDEGIHLNQIGEK